MYGSGRGMEKRNSQRVVGMGNEEEESSLMGVGDDSPDDRCVKAGIPLCQPITVDCVDFRKGILRP